MKAHMTISTKKTPEVPGEDSSRGSAYEHGYVHGERSRKLNYLPPKNLMFGIGDYALGFRAGYFANVRTAPRAGSVGR